MRPASFTAGSAFSWIHSSVSMSSPGDGLASFPSAGRFVESDEDVHEALCVDFCFFQMLLERSLEHILTGGFGHGRQSFDQLGFRVVQVAQFRYKEIFEGIEFWHDFLGRF